jgi:hypothetical protein
VAEFLAGRQQLVQGVGEVEAPSVGGVAPWGATLPLAQQSLALARDVAPWWCASWHSGWRWGAQQSFTCVWVAAPAAVRSLTPAGRGLAGVTRKAPSVVRASTPPVGWWRPGSVASNWRVAGPAWATRLASPAKGSCGGGAWQRR